MIISLSRSYQLEYGPESLPKIGVPVSTNKLYGLDFLWQQNKNEFNNCGF